MIILKKNSLSRTFLSLHLETGINQTVTLSQFLGFTIGIKYVILVIQFWCNPFLTILFIVKGGRYMDRKTNDNQDFDFAISYAGEEGNIAGEVVSRLRERGYSVFFAAQSQSHLVGENGESVFQGVFINAKQVVVFMSKNYMNKSWTKYEWDVIRKRPNGFIPVRLDGAESPDLPSNLLYLTFTGSNYSEIIETAEKRLIDYEREKGIQRPSEYERILASLKNESKGAVAEGYQLVKEKRTRTPLEDYKLPEGSPPIYEVVEEEWCNFSVVKRLGLKILLPASTSKEEVRHNLIYCAALHFNKHKPDAVIVHAYYETEKKTDINGPFTAGKAVFAPFGKWEKAQNGVAYNLPVSDFEFDVELA